MFIGFDASNFAPSGGVTTSSKLKAGVLCNNIHEVCSESYNFQKQLDEACKKFNLKTLSIGYDPTTDIADVPNNPKKRYKVMTREMPKNGELSLEMMYQTCGTQINLDYTSEQDFIKKFKVISYLTPINKLFLLPL